MVNTNKLSTLSSWLMILFVIILSALAAYTELFDNKIKVNKELTNISAPIRADILETIKSIRIKNKLGSFVISNEQGSWLIKEPTVMPAKTATINKVIQSLKSINVHTVHQKDKINLQSFSLDLPVLTIDLYSKLDEHIKIHFGLINPINKTSYMTVSGTNTIFQTDIPINSIDQFELNDFLDARIFSFSPNEIKEFVIKRRGQKKPITKITSNGNNWISDRYKNINQNKVSKKITSILDIKTHMIIDDVEGKLKTFVENYLNDSLYTVQIKNISGKEVNYKVSGLINAISELKIEKKQYFLMKATNRKFPYLIPKQYLDNFIFKYNDYK